MIKFSLPHNHSATIGLGAFESKFGVIDFFTVEEKGVLTQEGSSEKTIVKLESQGFIEEDEVGFGQVTKMFRVEVIAAEAFHIP